MYRFLTSWMHVVSFQIAESLFHYEFMRRHCGDDTLVEFVVYRRMERKRNSESNEEFLVVTKICDRG